MSSVSLRLRDLQFRLEYIVLRVVVGVVRAFPLEMATSISARTWRFLAPRINPKRHARALDNLAIAFPEKSPAERQAIALAHWENLGRVMAETMQIDKIIAQPDRIEIVNQGLFNRYRDKLGAAVGVSLHMGNWELAVWPLALAARIRPASIGRSTTPTSTSTCATSAGIRSPAACLVAAASKAITATRRRPRG